jgi:hypothetical protein
MAIGKLVRMTGGQGLLLALCRRARAIFWAAVGAMWLLWLSKSRRQDEVNRSTDNTSAATAGSAQDLMRPPSLCQTVFILANDIPRKGEFEPVLAPVATLPLLLRTIIGVRGKERTRTILVLDPANSPGIRAELLKSDRVPSGVEWMSVQAGTPISILLRNAGLTGGTVAFVNANCNYKPTLLRTLHDWDVCRC